MPIEIKEMVINTSVQSSHRPTAATMPETDVAQMKKDIIKECMEKLKEHLQRQTQR